MASQKAQRIGIWIIAIVMTVGSIGSFFVIILQNNNQAKDLAAQQKASDESAAASKQSAALNAANFEGFDGYTSQAFDATSATALKVETLVDGTGTAVKATDSVNVSYFGWTSDGVIFDSSKKKDASADAPISLPLSGVIKGWTEGLTGVKEGSIVRLTIPSDLGYGATGQGTIPANAPLQFIVSVHKIEAATTSTAQ